MSKRIGEVVSCFVLVITLGVNQVFAEYSESDRVLETRLDELIEIVKINEFDGNASVIDKLQAVVQKGDQATRAEAQLLLGRIYRDGLVGMGKNKNLSFIFFEHAAGTNGLNTEAQYELGRAYMNGEGTDRNLIAAYIWTELSLNNNTILVQQAELQKKKLASMLNAQQLAKAEELVTQLEILYLQ
ncbi:MAG: tetratricopeptide repeat protein [Endozoicomonas sp.]